MGPGDRRKEGEEEARESEGEGGSLLQSSSIFNQLTRGGYSDRFYLDWNVKTQY